MKQALAGVEFCRGAGGVLASKAMASASARMRLVARAVALLLAAGTVLGAAGSPQVRPPALVAGESLLYRLQYRSGIQSSSSGPIYNPEAAHRLQISLSARLRLDVLSVKSDPKRGRLTSLRATYESSDASVQSDAYDAGAEALEKRYRELEGRSFEFTIDGAGRVRQVAGLDRLDADERVRSAIRQWLGTVTLPLGVWQRGMKPGHKWEREEALVGTPLAGLAWRSRSTYRDNEECPPAPGAHPGLARETCAVIVTRLDTVRRGEHGDPTPPVYRRQGLRTSGRWKGTGESLSYVSLTSGLVTSSTANESDEMDLTIAAEGGSRLRYAGTVESVSQITLLSIERPAAGKSKASGGTRPRN
jgi:hypothetical protein